MTKSMENDPRLHHPMYTIFLFLALVLYVIFQHQTHEHVQLFLFCRAQQRRVNLQRFRWRHHDISSWYLTCTPLGRMMWSNGCTNSVDKTLLEYKPWYWGCKSFLKFLIVLWNNSLFTLLSLSTLGNFAENWEGVLQRVWMARGAAEEYFIKSQEPLCMPFISSK